MREGCASVTWEPLDVAVVSSATEGAAVLPIEKVLVSPHCDGSPC